jgi:hypothetical protein
MLILREKSFFTKKLRGMGAFPRYISLQIFAPTGSPNWYLMSMNARTDMPEAHLLVVDDDREIRNLLKRFLG